MGATIEKNFCVLNSYNMKKRFILNKKRNLYYESYLQKTDYFVE